MTPDPPLLSVRVWRTAYETRPRVGGGIDNIQYSNLSVCLFPCNRGGYFVSLLVEPMAGKNASPSDEK